MVVRAGRKFQIDMGSLTQAVLTGRQVEPQDRPVRKDELACASRGGNVARNALPKLLQPACDILASISYRYHHTRTGSSTAPPCSSPIRSTRKPPDCRHHSIA